MFSTHINLICLKCGMTIKVKAIAIKGDQKNTSAIILIIMADLPFLLSSESKMHSPRIVDINCWGPWAKVINEEKYFKGTGSLNKYLSMIQYTPLGKNMMRKSIPFEQ